MKESNSLLLNTADEFLTPHSRARKRELQKQITVRRELKAPLVDQANSDPRGVTAGTRFEEARRARLNQPSSLADDQKNRFDRHQEVVNAQRRDTTAHDNRVDRIAEQHARWVHQTAAAKMNSGRVLGKNLEQLKKDSDASRTAAKHPPRTINLSVYQACVAVAVQPHLPLFVGEPLTEEEHIWNQEVFNRFSQARLKSGEEVAPELFTAAIEDGFAGNHFQLPYQRDPVSGGRVRKRGGPILRPPTMPPRVIWGDETAILEQEAQAERIRLGSEEAQRSLKMAFDDLQKVARQKFHPPRAGDPGDRGVR